MKLVTTDIALPLGGAFGVANARQVELPPWDSAGQRYARVFIPPKTEVTTQQAQLTAATKRVEIIPVRYEVVTEEVMVKHEMSWLEIIPASYENVSEQVMTREASVQSKRSCTCLGKARQVKAVVGGQVDDDVMWLVEVPAEYKTVKVTRMDEAPKRARDCDSGRIRFGQQEQAGIGRAL